MTAPINHLDGAMMLTDEQIVDAIKSVCDPADPGFPGALIQFRAETIAMGRAVERALLSASKPVVSFQECVQPWMLECFGQEIAADKIERNHRFFEEATEAVQANGMTRSEAHQLVDYTFDRPIGELHQEIGGVMVTLAALCLASGQDMHAAGETELARIWTKVEAIRAKQAAKPKHSPLPAAPAQSEAIVDDLRLFVSRLARSLRLAKPDNALAEEALDYLKRKGLFGSPLREAAQSAQTERALIAQLNAAYAALDAVADWAKQEGADDEMDVGTRLLTLLLKHGVHARASGGTQPASGGDHE